MNGTPRLGQDSTGSNANLNAKKINQIKKYFFFKSDNLENERELTI